MIARKCYWISICLISIRYGAPFQSSEPSISRLRPANNEVECISTQCKMTAARFRQFMSPTVKPCTDMYTHVCKNYGMKNDFKPHQQWMNALVERQQEIDQLVLEFLHDTKDNDLPAVKNSRSYFHQCLDEDFMERGGDMPIIAELNKVGLPIRPPFNVRLKTEPNFSRLIGRMNRRSIAHHFLVINSVYFDERDERRRCILYFGNITSVNAMPQSDSIYTYAPPNKQQLGNEKQLAYKEYVIDIVNYMNRLVKYNYATLPETHRDIEKWAQNVADFIVEIEKINEIGNKRNNIDDTRFTTIPKLQKITDDIMKNARVKLNWYDYLEVLFENVKPNTREIFESNETVLVKDIRTFKRVLEVMAKVDPNVLIGAMWFKSIEGVIPMASKALRNIQGEYKKKVTKSDPFPREKVCLDYAKTLFVSTITHYIMQKDDVVAKKPHIEQMVEDIKASFDEIITNAGWMSDKTKMAALHKLDNIRSTVGYADWMQDLTMVNSRDGRIIVTDTSFYTTEVSLLNYSRDVTFAYLQHNSANPLTVIWYYASPLISNAGYFPQANALAVPMAIMGFPLFGLGLPCLDLGAIGFYIAHELGHAFDDLGTHYTTWGTVGEEWVKKRDMKKLKEFGQCLINKYGEECYPNLDRCVNGSQSLGENIADMTGFTVALNACRRYVKRTNGYHPKLVKFPELDHEQLFTLAFAHNWCEKITDVKQTYFIDYAYHSPYPSRLRGVLKNSKDFARIWNCEETDAMNPPDKCELWGNVEN